MERIDETKDLSLLRSRLKLNWRFSMTGWEGSEADIVVLQSLDMFFKSCCTLAADKGLEP